MSAGEPLRLRLSHDMRLRVQADFRRLKQDGVRLTHGCIVANWLVNPGAATSRLAVITSKRLGGATVRTRVRRLLREVFRVHQHELKETVDMVLVARQSIVGKGHEGVQKDLLTVWRRGGLLKLGT